MSERAPAPPASPPPWRRAAALVAATYFYFLLFAEFALLELAAPLAASPADLTLLMGALGAGGIAGSVLGAALHRADRADILLPWALRACALAALVAPFAHNRLLLLAVSAAVGLSLGALTVLLAASLRALAGAERLGFCAGLGTGVAYAACNLPVIFTAPPSVQALAAAAVTAAASFAVPRTSPGPTPPTAPDTVGFGALRWIVLLGALVWMDSAAFYIIQHTDHLRAATWAGAWTLGGNSLTHLVAALLVGYALDRGARAGPVVVAFVALAAACLTLNGTLPGPGLAAVLYTAGVSVYSVVLVHYPAAAARPRLAGAVYAIAGWAGSALGIGMARDLARIPNTFVIAAALVLGAALAWRNRAAARTLSALAAPAVLALFLAAPPLGAAPAASPAAADPLARGREVYIAEGCLHCHSQYVRPRVDADVERWGPAATLEAVLAAPPPLLGNRRQGPDLANVGLRRSPEWNRLHLLAPRELSPGSRMPTYAHLFAPGDDRGDALVAYLASLGASARAERDALIARWQPVVPASAGLSPGETARIFVRTCAPCHGTGGRGDGPVASRLALPPPNWTVSGWRRLAATPDAARDLAAARLVKFGLPGTAMPGHEALPDATIVALVRHIRGFQPVAPPPTLAALDTRPE